MPSNKNNDEKSNGKKNDKESAAKSSEDANKISGTKNDDALHGSDGDDRINGGQGNDAINGNAGDDKLHGNGGDDVITGGSDSDKVKGNGGDDTLVFDASKNSGAQDSYYGGGGFDTLHLILSAAQAADPAIQAEIAGFKAFLAQGSHADHDKGKDDDHHPHTEGHGNQGGKFEFQTLGLTVRNIEAITVEVTGGSVNTAPLALNDAFNADEDTALTIPVAQLLANDSDADGDTLSVIAVSNALHGTVTLSEGVVTFAPEAGFFGSASFDYSIDDGQGGSAIATVMIEVNKVDIAPIARPDAFALQEDSVLADTVAGNDDVSNDSEPGFSVVSAPAHGILVFNADGSFIYTPDANYAGEDTFTYVVSDGGGDSDPATVSLTIEGVNDAPVAGDDTRNTDEDLPLAITVTELLDNDSDVELDSLTLTGVGNALNGNVSLAGGDITFTPDADFNGAASFEYTVDDGNGGTTTGTVNVTVNPVNDDPVAVADDAAIDEDTALNLTVAALLDNDTDVDLDTLSVSEVNNAVNGMVTLHDGVVTFVPDANFNGAASFEYTLDDGNGGFDTATVNITVNPVNDAPVANDDAFEVDENGVLNSIVASNDSDVDGDALAYTVLSGPANGALTLNADGSFSYTPLPEFYGADAFTYTVTDGSGLSDTASVAIDILRAADKPTQVIHEANIAAGTTVVPLSIQSLLAGFVATEVLSINVAGMPAGSALNKGVDNLDGSYTLTAAQLSGLAITLPGGTAGTVPLTVTTTADDGGPLSTQTATLNINFGAAGTPEIVTGLGGDRNDTINGGSANDYLSGGAGDDLLKGNNGNDIIVGGNGSNDRAGYNDLIQNYAITTTDGADFSVTDLHATSGSGDDGTDTLSEVEGMSTVNFIGYFTAPATGGALQMTAGNDIAVAYGANVTADYTGAVVGTSGISLVMAQAVGGFAIGTSQSGVDVLRGIRNIIGSEFNDSIYGDTEDNLLNGADGDDLLQGNHGDDTIVGGNGSNDRAGYNDLIQNYAITTTDGSDFSVTDLHATSGSGDDGTDDLSEVEGMSTVNFNGYFTAPAAGGVLQMTAGNDIAVAYGANVTADYTGAVSGSAGISLNMAQAVGGFAIGTSQSGADVLRGIRNITGSEFNDTIYGDNQDNVLAGGDGDDLLQGNNGNDTIIGGNGSNDRAGYNDLIQNYAITTTNGSGFTVTDLHLTSGFGDDGTDNLSTVEGMNAANFNGYFTAPAAGGALQMTAGNDIAVGYGANTTADYTGAVSGSTGISLNMAQAVGGFAIGTSQSGADLLRGIRNITGSEFNDTIYGDTEDNVLAGGDGDDLLQGNNGDDTIIGGNGSNDRAGYNDLIQNYAITTTDGSDFSVTDLHATSGSGDDGTDALAEVEGMSTANFNGHFTATAVGGALQMTAGNDIAVAYGSNVSADYTGAVTGSAGISLNMAQAVGGFAIGTSQSGADLLRGIRNITGSEFNDSIYGDTEDNVLSGGDGDDLLQGNNGDDTIVGGNGTNDRAGYNDLIQNYSITTTNGSDFTVTDLHLTSGLGDDGTDTLSEIEGMSTANFNGHFTAPAVGGVFQMTSANDIAIAYAGNVTVEYTGAVVGNVGISINLAQAASGAAIGTSQSASDLLRGILNITGSEFNDSITGDTQANILRGGTGNDNLFGGSGADTLIGGLGDDILWGEGDSDIFMFADGDGADTIHGFAAGTGSQDVIDFSGVASLNSLADVQANSVQVGGNVQISYGGDQVTLVGVLLTNLHTDDFQF